MAQLKYSGPITSIIRQRDMQPDNDEYVYRLGDRVAWKCNCGGRSFELRPDGAYCIKCDAPATDWANAF